MAIPEGYEKLAVIGIAYKGEYDPETEYHIMNAVYYEGSTYVALKEHPEGVPTADGANWMYLAKGFIQNMLDTVNAKDTSGLLGEPGGVVSAQTLMDKIADKMTKELVTNTALQNKLANYILKNQIVNSLLATQPGNPLDATQGKILADKFAQLNSDTSENFTNSEYFNDYVQFYRIGRIVYCSYGGDIKKLVPSKEVQILKLPQKFLPVKDYILMTSPPTGGTIQITISKIGWIVAYNYGQEIASLSPSRFSAAYIAAE